MGVVSVMSFALGLDMKEVKYHFLEEHRTLYNSEIPISRHVLFAGL